MPLSVTCDDSHAEAWAAHGATRDTRRKSFRDGDSLRWHNGHPMPNRCGPPRQCPGRREWREFGRAMRVACRRVGWPAFGRSADTSFGRRAMTLRTFARKSFLVCGHVSPSGPNPSRAESDDLATRPDNCARHIGPAQWQGGCFPWCELFGQQRRVPIPTPAWQIRVGRRVGRRARMRGLRPSPRPPVVAGPHEASLSLSHVRKPS